MNIEMKEDKFHIRAYFAPCHCHCKFCCLGDYPKNKQISFEDYEKVMKKFEHISDYNNMRLRSFIYNCAEHQYLGRQIALYKLLPMVEDEYSQLDLNGTMPRSKDEIRRWLGSLVESGIKKVAFSWFGLQETHDTFVNRQGYYSYLITCAEVASEMGLPVISKVFLHKNNLNEIESLIEMLESFSSVIVCALMEYSGNAKSMEADFVTNADIERLPQNARRYISEGYLRKFRTESDWIDAIQKNDYTHFSIVDYILYVDATNIEWVMNSTVDDILAYFRNMNKDYQSFVPNFETLANIYGDKKCTILYEFRDVIRKWIDRYCLINNIDNKYAFSFTKNSVEWKVYERL